MEVLAPSFSLVWFWFLQEFGEPTSTLLTPHPCHFSLPHCLSTFQRNEINIVPHTAAHITFMALLGSRLSIAPIAQMRKLRLGQVLGLMVRGCRARVQTQASRHATMILASLICCALCLGPSPKCPASDWQAGEVYTAPSLPRAPATW